MEYYLVDVMSLLRTPVPLSLQINKGMEGQATIATIKGDLKLSVLLIFNSQIK